MTDRMQLGVEKFGIPAQETVQAILAVVSREPWNRIPLEAVEYYLDKMPLGWLPEMADAHLGDDELASLDPQEVRDAVFLLTRDMFRHNARTLLAHASARWDDDWVDLLFDEIADEAGLPPRAYADWHGPFPLDDPFDHEMIAWAVRLAKPFNAQPEKLAITHEAIVEGVILDVLEPDDDSDFGEDEDLWDDEGDEGDGDEEDWGE